jgi:flavoprotein
MRIAWAFTGAGHLLLESVEELEKLAVGHEVTVMLSRAAQEVLKPVVITAKLPWKAIKNSVFP